MMGLAFCNVDLSAKRFKVASSLCVIEGSVASQSDLGRLKSLGTQHGFLSHMDHIKVIDASTTLKNARDK
jgi:hypothetical protein